MADEVAAYAAVEQFTDTGDGRGGRELGVDGEVAKFVLEESEAVVGR